MPRRPAAYPPAYREQIIALARAGRTAKQLAAEFEPSEQTIRNWIFQAQADRGEHPGALTTEECLLRCQPQFVARGHSAIRKRYWQAYGCFAK